MTSFVAEIARRVLAGSAPAVVGLDPRLAAFPRALAPEAEPPERIVAFYETALPVLREHVPCVKPNIAFFEAYGAAGYRAYEETCRLAREQGLLVLGDIKRGDIGSTAAAYAKGHFQHADAVTLHPYLGGDSIAPFLEYCGDGEHSGDGKSRGDGESRGDGSGQPQSAGRADDATGGKAVFVLVRTSNPGASDLQDLVSDGRALCDHVAEAVHRWGAELPHSAGYSPVGAVVGATWPEELARLRKLMPAAWLLLPGVGAQGGKVEDLAAAFDDRGLGALVNQSRGVMQCFEPDAEDWLERIGQAAASFAAECRAVAQGKANAGGNQGAGGSR